MSESMSKSMREAFNRYAWDSNSPSSQSTTIAACFQSQKLWGLLFLALEPRVREPSVGLGPLAP